jgi:hypothetical protein
MENTAVCTHMCPSQRGTTLVSLFRDDLMGHQTSSHRSDDVRQYESACIYSPTVKDDCVMMQMAPWLVGPCSTHLVS